MLAYYLTKPVALRTKLQGQFVKAIADVRGPAASEIRIAAQEELKLVRAALRKNYPQEPRLPMLRVLDPASVDKLPGVPPRLGATAFRDPVAEAPPNVLRDQLRSLVAAHPNRKHFRLLLINGFGTNLGDNLIGLAAFRHVLAALRGALPEVSVDVLLGWHADDRLRRQFRDIDGIDNILTHGPTLAELGRYQGLFDTGNLLNLPRYGKMPIVDWYLWWMGLDPADIAAADKRNAVAIPEADRQFVAERLPAGEGPRILVNPVASVTLRSMPQPAATRLIETLLAEWPTAQIILLHPGNVDHPRVHLLKDAINTVDRLAALVAAVDGLIGVDTYTAHLADATGTPSVTLYTSIGPELYPYYPLAESLLLPGAAELPGWGKSKVPPEIWAGMADRYAAAWQTIDMRDVVAALRRVKEKKRATPGAFVPELLPPRAPVLACPMRNVASGGLVLEVPLRQREDWMAPLLNETIGKLAAQALRPGDTVVHLGPGAGEAAVGLARAVGPCGRLIAVEPRRALHQLLCANLARAGLWHAEIHLAMPEGQGFARREIDSLQVADESQPLLLSNCGQPEPVVCWPLDSLALDTCSLLVMSSPLARFPVLQGAQTTLERLRPVVLIGVVGLQHAETFETFFSTLNYRVRALRMSEPGVPAQSSHYGILVAEPVASAQGASTPILSD